MCVLVCTGFGDSADFHFTHHAKEIPTTFMQAAAAGAAAPPRQLGTSPVQMRLKVSSSPLAVSSGYGIGPNPGT